MLSPVNTNKFNNSYTDYSNAILNIVCLLNINTKVTNLIIGFIELLTTEYKPNELICNLASIRFNDYKLLYSRLHISVLDALNIYRDSLHQNLILFKHYPIYHGELIQTTYPDCPYVSDHHSLPLIAPHWASVRIFSAFPAELPETYSLINFEKIADWLAERLHFDLVRKNSELIGSLHLILPNPIYRSLSLRLEPDEQRVQIHCDPRPGKEDEAKNLELCLREKRLYGYTESNFQTLKTLTSYRTLAGPAEQIGFCVRSLKYGLLAISDFAPFSHRVAADFDVRQEVLNIKAKMDRTAFKTEVNSSHTFDMFNVGSTEDQPLTKLGARLHSEHFIKRTHQEAVNLGQFICDDVKTLQDFLEYIFRAAQSQILIIDTSFDVISFVRFIVTLTIINVRVSLYTTTKSLEKYSQDSLLSHGSQQQTNADVLHEILESKTSLFKYNIYVIYNSSKFYDRLIIIDDTVWIIMTSLKNIDSRLNVIMRLPDSKNIIKIINNVLSNTPTKNFKTWYENHYHMYTNNIQHSEVIYN